MKIECLEISGFRSALEALRLPYSLEPRSISSHNNELYRFNYHKCEWKELYDRILHAECSECPPEEESNYDASFQTHTRIAVHKNDISLLQALVKRGPEHAKCIRGINVYAKITAPIYWWCEMETYTVGHYRLASESTMHTDCKGLSGEDLQKAKASIPMGKELTKIDMFNYQNLRNIVKQREGHRLPEWKIFIDWVKTLPYSEEFIFC